MLAFSFSSANKETISFIQALQKGLITLDIHGRNDADLPEDASTYYGKCVVLTVKNTSGKALQLSMENGQLLHSVDSGAQDLIITQPLIMALAPASEKSENLYAMCTQMSHWSPGEEDAFNIGPMAGEDLRNLTDIINRNRIQNKTGQDAVWVLTDALPIHNIYGETNQVQILKDYLIPIVENSANTRTTIKYKSSGTFKFRLLENSKASMILYNQQGEEFQVYFRDKFFRRGIYSMKYDYSNEYMEAGIYTLKLKIEGKPPKFKQFIVQ